MKRGPGTHFTAGRGSPWRGRLAWSKTLILLRGEAWGERLPPRELSFPICKMDLAPPAPWVAERIKCAWRSRSFVNHEMLHDSQNHCWFYHRGHLGAWKNSPAVCRSVSGQQGIPGRPRASGHVVNRVCLPLSPALHPNPCSMRNESSSPCIHPTSCAL